MDLLFNAIVCSSSLALLLYWFRYACLLIFAAETPHDYSEDVARANQLSFPEVQAILRRHEGTDLDFLHNCLRRDFAIIAGLMKHTPISTFDMSVEDALVSIHFHTMSACFRLTRSALREFALDALEEMSMVVAHVANQCGGRSAAY